MTHKLDVSKLSLVVAVMSIVVLLLFPMRAFAANSDSPASPALSSTTLSTSAMVVGNPSWTLSKTAVTLKDYSNSTIIYVYGYDDDYEPVAYSSDDSIVSAGFAYGSGGTYYFSLYKEGVGKATVTVYDESGNSRAINVTCNPNDFQLSAASKFTFSKKTASYSGYYISKKYDSNNNQDAIIKRAKSSKPKVASAKVLGTNEWKYVQITPKKAGKTAITVTDQYGRAKTIAITVKKNYFKANLKYRTGGYAACRSKKMSVYSAPKAKVVVKIGGRKYTKRTDKNGFATIKLKKEPALNSKYSISAKTNRAKATVKGKVASSVYASIGTVTSCKYYCDVHASNVRKGDTIILKVGSETYKQKVSFSTASYNTTFWTRYPQRSYWHYRVIVKNKKGKTLSDHTSNISWR